MPVSIISCNLDRKTADLATIKAPGIAGSAGTSGGGSYKLGYDVVMAAISGPINVCSQAISSGAPDLLPALWGTYSYQGDTDTHSFAKSYQVARDLKVQTRYYVMVNFEPAEPGEIPDGGGTPIKATADPLLRKPVYWWDRELSTRVDAVAQDGSTVILNAASNLYEELIETERAKGQLVVEFNLATMGALIDFSRTYDQTVNATTWSFKERVFPDRSVMIREISAGDVKSEGSHTYVPVAVRLAFADVGKTFDVSRPEMGQTHYTKRSDGSYVTTGSFRQRTDAGSVVPLNADGTRLEDGLPPLISNWRIRREADFSALPFLAIA